MVTEKIPSRGGNLARFFRIRRWPFPTVCLLVVLLAGVLPCAVAVARPKQKYDTLEVDLKLKQNSTKVNSILMAGRFGSPADSALFDEFYKKYFLAQWTEPKNVAKLPGFRKDLRNSLKKGGGEVHNHLNALLLEFMKDLATGSYHPAVQVNAMLMIGDLNSVEQPPTPLPEALTFLLASVEDAKLSDALRVAALIGIERHVAPPGIADEEVRKTLVTALLKLASVDPGDNAGRQWILAQTVETLGSLGVVGENNAVFKAILNTLSDSKLSLRTRGVAAVSLGRLAYSGAAGIDPVEATTTIGRYAIDVCGEELRLAKDGDKGVSRQRLKQGLSAAMMALIGGEDPARKGIASLAREQAQQAFSAELQKLIKGMIDLIDDKKHEEEDLKGPVEKLQGNLEAWLKKKPK